MMPASEVSIRDFKLEMRLGGRIVLAVSEL